MKKIVEIKQTYRYFAEVEVTEEQLEKINNGEYDGINYDHVDKYSDTNYEITWHETNDNPAFKAKLESVFELSDDDEEQKAIVKLFYRCGGNYKYYFDVVFPASELPDIKAGDEDVEIERLGMTPDEMYTAAGVQVDPELDHNLVDVLEIIYEPENE